MFVVKFGFSHDLKFYFIYLLILFFIIILFF